MALTAKIIVASILLFAVSNTALAEDSKKHAAEPNAHANHGKAIDSSLELNSGKKWPTDQAMRQGMEKIHKFVLEAIPKSKGKNAPDLTDKTVADGIKSEIDKVIANCKLSPKADSTFHVILADVLGGVANLKGDGGIIRKPSDSYAQIAKGLNNYNNFFDHPGFIEAHDR